MPVPKCHFPFKPICFCSDTSCFYLGLTSLLFESDMSLFGHDMSLFERVMYLFGNVVFFFGDDMFQFENDLFLCRIVILVLFFPHIDFLSVSPYRFS